MTEPRARRKRASTQPVGIAAGDTTAPRLLRLLLLRTLVITVVLGLSVWLGVTAPRAGTVRNAVWLESAVIAATYASTIVFGLLLRRGMPPRRVAAPMYANDLVVTSALVYVTGGSASPYMFLYALSIVAAGALSYRRGAAIVAGAAIALALIVSLAAWEHALGLQISPVKPWEQTGGELVRSLGINLAALIGVGALAFTFGDQLQRGAETLATTRRAAAEMLTLHEDIVRSLTSGLITTDSEGRVLSSNAVAAELLELEPSQIDGRPLAEVMPALPELAAPLADGGGPRRAEIAIPKGDRELVIGATVSPLRDVHEQVIGQVINFQDLTKLRQLELASRRAERLATVGQLAAGIAHEIRNPLASISGSIELLRQAPQASDDDRTLMAIVHREIQRLNVMLGDLLDYANPRPMQPVDFDLGALVEETLRVARAEPAFADVELAGDVEQPLPFHGDPAKLRQVVWNLVRNARDAAQTGGKHVRVAARRLDGAAGGARIAVHDDGPGIAPELVARIFDPFVTTKEKGTGLGLATCHAVVAEHRGRIDVETRGAAAGTTLVVSLPPGDAAR